MRDYAKVVPTFWTGQTGRALRSKGHEAVVVALYLMTSPHSNMLGLFYQPVLYMAHETGLGLDGATKGLKGCIDASFCKYDKASETVWVIEMAAFQIAPNLKVSDLRCKGIQKDVDSLVGSPFLPAFVERYGKCFHVTFPLNHKVPTKPLPSQEQEQEQEQEREEDICGSADAEPPANGFQEPKPAKSDPIPFQAIIDAYNERLPHLAKVITVSADRRTAIRKAWMSLPEAHRKPGAFKAIFAECALDDFLNGTGPYSGDHSNWRPDFDFLVKTKTLTKVYEKAMARRERSRQLASVELQPGAQA